MKPIITILLSICLLSAKADDTAIIQSRINSAKKEVTFSPDTMYAVSKTIDIPSGLRVNNLHLRITSNTPAITLNSNSYLYAVMILGNYNNKAATVAGIGSSGVVINGSNNIIQSTIITNVSAYGIINSGDMNTINSCTITNTGYISIFSLGQNAVICGNRINRSAIPLANIKEKCISVRGNTNKPASYTTVWSNTCIMPYGTQWSEECIEFMNAQYGVVAFNLTRGGSIGISIVGSDYTKVNNNTVDTQILEGLEIANCKYISMSNNNVLNQVTGILVDANESSQYNAINYNTITASSVGIDIGINCPNNIVNGGSIACNKGISIGGVTGTTISNVQITGATQAVVLDQSRGDVSGTSVINCIFIGYRSPVYLYATKPIVTSDISLKGTVSNNAAVSLIKDLSNGATVK